MSSDVSGERGTTSRMVPSCSLKHNSSLFSG